jgi:hypothetical protein
MTNGPKTIESILSLIPDERILKRVYPSDIILFEPIGFIAPIILFIAALEYLTSQPIFSLLLIVGGIVSFIFITLYIKALSISLLIIELYLILNS